jgi:hypothetical protein
VGHALGDLKNPSKNENQKQNSNFAHLASNISEESENVNFLLE